MLTHPPAARCGLPATRGVRALPVLLTALALAVGCSSSPTPTADAGTPDAPSTDAPSTDAPSTDAPSTDAPDGGSLDVPTADVPTADVPTADVPTADVPPDAPPAEPRLVVLSREGRIASVGLAAPYAVRASADLRATVGSARCRFGLCVVTHPEPANALSVVSAADLTVRATIALGDRVDPRDVAIVDDHTAVVSLYERAELLQVDLVTRATAPIDLRALADADGLPEATWLATCGRRVFAQLRRVDHESGADSPMGAVLAVVDLARPAGDRLVDADPAAPGVQGVALARRPAFDMPVDCAAGTLHVAEPLPLMRGGGGYEVVDLATLSATASSLDVGAEIGGFEVVGPNQYWTITHTEFGPGPSSHLNYTGVAAAPTHNTFAREHVNDLAFDRETDRLFYPDPCTVMPTNPGCVPGVHVFGAHAGPPSTGVIDVGFAPLELAISR